MEDAALNLAHRERRRGEKHASCGRLEAAAACHQRAARLLETAALKARGARARESIALQREFHAGQQRLLSLQRTQLDSYKRALDKQSVMEGIARQQAVPMVEDSASLQEEIMRTMEEADSLVLRLMRPADNSDETDAAVPASSRRRLPKEEGTVVEELLTINAHLRSLVSQLSSQLEAAVREAGTLRAQLAALRSPPPTLPPLPMPDLDFSIFEKHSVESDQ